MHIRNTSSPHWRAWLKPENRSGAREQLRRVRAGAESGNRKKDVVWSGVEPRIGRCLLIPGLRLVYGFLTTAPLSNQVSLPTSRYEEIEGAAVCSARLPEDNPKQLPA